jgi:hypothetical protein
MRAIQHVPQYINLGSGLDSDAGKHAAVMDITDQLARASLQLRLSLGSLGSRRHSCLIVEAVQITASLLEFLDPFLRLCMHAVVSV